MLSCLISLNWCYCFLTVQARSSILTLHQASFVTNFLLNVITLIPSSSSPFYLTSDSIETFDNFPFILVRFHLSQWGLCSPAQSFSQSSVSSLTSSSPPFIVMTRMHKRMLLSHPSVQSFSSVVYYAYDIQI